MPFKNLSLAVAAGLLCAHTYASTLTLNCADAQAGTLNQKAAESRLMAESHGLAERIAPHVLRINVEGKTLLFKDIPSDGLDNIAYTFCGSRGGYSLIAWDDGGEFTGKLIDERTGRILPAGREVIFSPDGRAYLAIWQEDGLDGDDWAVRYADDGRVSWQGYSFIASRDIDNTPLHELSNPKWTASGKLTAEASCRDTPNALVGLIKVQERWSWHVPTSCHPAR
ncbi:hypothetical protein [Burkholderia sp. LMG 32019]|uniref:hypothetical protein n=1 Tax=Burkholderia sp. LMG 32019 TaxID=3158173 RepID=UPI003C2EE0B3